MQQRNITTAIILSIVTCGIYGIFWFIQLTDDVRTLAGDTQTASGGTAFLLTLVTCNIYGWYWAYKRGENIDTIKTQRGAASSNSGILYIILQALGLGIINYAIMQSEVNNAIAAQQ